MWSGTTIGTAAVGRTTDPGEAEILIGQTAAFSGPLGAAVKTVFDASTLAFQNANARGGISGRKVRVISLDDGLNPERAAANGRKLVEDERVVALFGTVGGGAVQSLLPELHTNQVALVAPYAVTDAARDRARGVVFCVRASFAREFEVLVQHLTTIGITRIGLARVAVAAEIPLLMREALARHGLAPAAEASIGLDGSGFEAGVSAIVAGRCQALILALDTAPAVRIVQALRSAGAPPAFYGLSLVDAERMWKALDGHTSGLVVAQVMPSPWNDVDPEIHAFRAACRGASMQPSYHGLEGWISARVLLEALARVGPTVNRASLLRALQGLRTRIAGMDVDFTAGSPTGSRFVELVQINEQGRFVR